MRNSKQLFLGLASCLMAIFSIVFAVVSPNSASAQCVSDWEIRSPGSDNDTVHVYASMIGQSVPLDLRNNISQMGKRGSRYVFQSSDVSILAPQDSIDTAVQNANSGSVSNVHSVNGADLNGTIYSATTYNVALPDRIWSRNYFTVQGDGPVTVICTYLEQDDANGPTGVDESANVCSITVIVHLYQTATSRNHLFTAALPIAPYLSTFYSSDMSCIDDPLSGQNTDVAGLVYVPMSGNVHTVRTQPATVDPTIVTATSARVAMQSTLPGATPLTAGQVIAADVNEDGIVSPIDGGEIKAYAAGLRAPSVIYVTGTGNDWNTATFSTPPSANCIATGLEFVNVVIGDATGNNNPVSVSMKTAETSGTCVVRSRPDAKGYLRIWFEEPVQDVALRLTNRDYLNWHYISHHPAFPAPQQGMGLEKEYGFAEYASRKVQTSFENPLLILYPEPSGAGELKNGDVKIRGSVDEQTTFDFIIENGGTSITDKIMENAVVSMYPNPTTSVLSLTVEKLPTDVGNPTISILDISGKKITTVNMVVTAKKATTEIDVTLLPVGAYFLRVDGTNWTQKFIKE